MMSQGSHSSNRYCLFFLPLLFFALSGSLHARTCILTLDKQGNGTGTVISGYPGIHCGENCANEFTEADSVVLMARADQGSVFEGWGGGCAGTGDCLVTVVSDVTATAVFSLIGSFSVEEGTIGTRIVIADTGFGTGKGKVSLGGRSCKVLEWADESITCAITKALSPGPYDVVVQPKDAAPITYEGAFTVMAPEITSVDPGSAPFRDIEITGSYFGTKKGDVYLIDPMSGRKKICRIREEEVDDDWGNEGKVEVYKKKCRIKAWTMDPTTGASAVTVTVRRRLRAGTTWGLEVVNRVGSAIGLFTAD